jgi:hypothetical protein
MLARGIQGPQHWLASRQRCAPSSRPLFGAGLAARQEPGCSSKHTAFQQLHKLEQVQVHACSSLQEPAGPQRASHVVAAAAGAGAADSTSSSSSRSTSPLEGKSELQSLLHSIPYKRLLLWGFVGAVGWQLHEFFGVSPRHGSPRLMGWATWHLYFRWCKGAVDAIRTTTVPQVVAASPTHACVVGKCIG